MRSLANDPTGLWTLRFVLITLAVTPIRRLTGWHASILLIEAVRGRAELNCPPEDGYRTAVTVLKVNEAIEANRRLDFSPEDFEV